MKCSSEAEANSQYYVRNTVKNTEYIKMDSVSRKECGFQEGHEHQGRESWTSLST